MKYHCPACNSQEMKRLDIPKHNISVCLSCDEVSQIVDEMCVPISNLLSLNAFQDDRIRAAVSRPHVSTVASFLEIYENSIRMWQMELATAAGGLRTVLAQIENRIDFALGTFSGLDLVSDDAGRGLQMLREARELVSTLPSRSRGMKEDSDDG